MRIKGLIKGLPEPLDPSSGADLQFLSCQLEAARPHLRNLCVTFCFCLPPNFRRYQNERLNFMYSFSVASVTHFELSLSQISKSRGIKKRLTYWPTESVILKMQGGPHVVSSRGAVHIRLKPFCQSVGPQMCADERGLFGLKAFPSKMKSEMKTWRPYKAVDYNANTNLIKLSVAATVRLAGEETRAACCWPMSRPTCSERTATSLSSLTAKLSSRRCVAHILRMIIVLNTLKIIPTRIELYNSFAEW